jgi:hypothetical protein
LGLPGWPPIAPTELLALVGLEYEITLRKVPKRPL